MRVAAALLSSPYLQLPPDPPPPPPLQPESRTSNMTMLYYGLVVAGTAALMIAVYNLLIIKWCGDSSQRNQQPTAEEEDEIGRRRGISGRATGAEEGGEWNSSRSFDNSRTNLITSSFKYKKGGGGRNRVFEEEEELNEKECAVCLSVFEEGEDVRQLPNCKHSFHMSCIDMWLHSHFDCPMCRSPVDLPPPALALGRLSCPVRPARDSRQGLLDPSIFAL